MSYHLKSYSKHHTIPHTNTGNNTVMYKSAITAYAICHDMFMAWMCQCYEVKLTKK